MEAVFREVMIWLCFSAAGILLLLAGVFFWLHRIFAHKPGRLDVVSASLVSTKYKKNLPIYEKWRLFGPKRVKTVVRHYCKGIYEYRVKDKKYRVRHVEFVTPQKNARDGGGDVSKMLSTHCLCQHRGQFSHL